MVVGSEHGNICCEVSVWKHADARKLKAVSKGEINETQCRMQFITATKK
jgi:hypothetical protein